MKHALWQIGFSLVLLLASSPTSYAQDGELVDEVANGNVEAVRRMLESGADPDASHSWKPEVPLTAAVRKRDVDMVRLLLDYGADPNAAPVSSTPPLYNATLLRSETIAKLLLAAGATDGLERAIHLAAIRGDVGFVQNLLEAGSHPSAADMVRAARFFRAARHGDVAAVEREIGEGVDPNLMLLDGWTALLAASEAGRVDVVGLLLENGADPDVTAAHPDLVVAEVTPLTCGVMSGRVDVVRVLLKNGADPNLGASPLALAASVGNASVVDLLLQAGADPSAFFMGSSAKDIAESNGDELLMRLLDGEGGDPTVREAVRLTDEAWHIAVQIQEWFRSNDEKFKDWHNEFDGAGDAGLRELSGALGESLGDRFETTAGPALSAHELELLQLSGAAGSYIISVSDRFVVIGTDPDSQNQVSVEIEDIYQPGSITARTTLVGN